MLLTVDSYDGEGNYLRTEYQHPKALPGTECNNLVPLYIETDERRHPLQVSVCDFCGRPGVKWDFPAADFVVPNDEAYTQVGTWASCDGCRPLVEARDWGALFQRFVSFNPGIGASPERRAHIVNMWKVFDSHRLGEPVSA